MHCLFVINELKPFLIYKFRNIIIEPTYFNLDVSVCNLLDIKKTYLNASVL